MQIIPCVGETIVSSGTVTIRINPADRERADDLILSTSTITLVKDERTFTRARDAMGQLKSLMNEIGDSEKSAKRPFTAITTKIGNLAKDVGGPVKLEHDRIQKLCNTYAARIEEEERQRREALRQAQLEAERKIVEARKAQALAKSESEKVKSQLAVAQAELTRQNIVVQNSEKKSIVPGGRVNHPWTFKLIDPVATLAAGGKRLLRIEVDHLACLDAVKAQLEVNPEAWPELPGIEIIRDTKVIVPATS